MSETPVIIIPNADSDSRIGKVLLSLFSVIEMTDSYGRNVVWDFHDLEYLHPFFISALAVYKDSLKDNVFEINVGRNLKELFNSIGYSSPLEFAGDVNPTTILMPYLNAGHVPVCKFSRKYCRIDEMQSTLFSIIASRIKSKIEGWVPHTPVSYLMSELTCNIQEHSHGSHGFMIMQCPEDEDSIYICIADNGITVHGSYMQSAKTEYIRMIGNDHAEALRYCTKGFSTKNRPYNESRGYGISTNLDMVVNGLGGAFFMLSGKAFFRSDENGEQFVNLPTGMNWDGTIILVRLPLKQKVGFDVYKYIE